MSSFYHYAIFLIYPTADNSCGGRAEHGCDMDVPLHPFGGRGSQMGPHLPSPEVTAGIHAWHRVLGRRGSFTLPFRSVGGRKLFWETLAPFTIKAFILSGKVLC